MIGMLNRTGLLRGVKLSRYYTVSSNLGNYLPCSSTSLIKSLPSIREMCKYVKPVTPKTLKLQTSDGVPLSYDIIYNSFDYHTICQYLSVAIPTISAASAAVVALKDFEELFPDPWTSALHLWVAAIFLYVNIGTAIISYKSPVRIYHNKETKDYKAIFNAFTPFKIRELNFKKGMVEQIPPPDVLTLFRFSRYRIKGQELYMFESFFRYPADLYGMFDELDDQYRDE